MLRIGFIGCGYISTKHMTAISQFASKGKVSLVAVSDVEEAKMEQAVAYYMKQSNLNESVLKIKDYHDLLAHAEIDVVVIAVTSGLHARIAKAALQRGKHIIIEKPLALSIQDADEIIALSNRYGHKVQICHQLRYRPLLQKIHQLVTAGDLGELYFGVMSMRLNRSESYFTSSTWKGTWEKDGGMLVNQGIHFVDLLLWLMGEPQSIYGELLRVKEEKEIEDVATGIITFQNGAKGLIEANTITKPKNIGYSMALFGSKGTICVGGKDFRKLMYCYVENKPEIKEQLLETQKMTDEYSLMYEDFIYTLEQNKENVLHAAEGKRALETIFALYQSHVDKKPITLPLEHFTTGAMKRNVIGKENDEDDG